ncbi:hypothetical protein BRYFOR_05449 [Marvinbryantia formatexigens DSM 14469]|uniref:TrbL/VirB6 plasmid conjugal transfer protein n=1 Tax=Marvinbryantia formatexigens DSM 14469 TaxID=478749 RepID=C6LA07_9FIRM|nr:type IV secretion system protein [Marvinbryantia formatexigens]EET62414.1 hypothetical protein BRYFOR_05449 [Marvinbryantia formatexigens DSM 14469]UWO25046.1 type IV secretion system protein [Marvinbryantia formatexigens DSM 14469]SDG28619.1 TrbL/VirB6 plasmid conjugal transfer protein [Marvinbryantia formatexigens]
MGFLDDIVKGLGDGLLGCGEWFLQGGVSFWRACSNVTLTYLEKNPASQTEAWGIVTGNIFSVALGIAGTLALIFMLLGWVRDSIDIRTTFTLDNIFKEFIRLALTFSLLTNCLAIITGVTECSTALVMKVSPEVTVEEEQDAFDELREEMDADDAGALEWIGMGIGGLICGLVGGATIIVCGMNLVLAVMSRMFKVLLCIPFAPPALAGFAGGGGFSQMGISWLKSFIGYGLEAVVIALAISISFGMFSDASLFSTDDATGVVRLILLTCDYCMPMLTAVACVKGADTVVRRCMGF